MLSLQEDPAAPLQCKGLNLTSASVIGQLDCFFCWSASPYLPLDPFSSRERPRSSKKGRRYLTSNVLPFLFLLSAFATHRGSTTVTSLGSCPLCLSACQGCFLFADPFPETLFGMTFAEHTFHTRLGLAQLVEQMALNLKVEGSTPDQFRP